MDKLTIYPIPERLIDSFKKEGVVIFVGAGLSMNEGLPSWQRLMDMLLAELSDELQAEELESVQKHISQNNFLLVADFLKSKMGEIRYKDFIEKTFKVKKKGIIHSRLMSMPFQGILTTNYDEILSQSDVDQAFGIPFTWDDSDIFRKTKSPFILHVHGIASNPGGTILSSTDYENLSHEFLNIKFWESIKNIFQNRKILFLGYSLNDPDLNLFLTKLKFILPGNTNEHFALIVCERTDPLNIYRLRELLGITPIIVNSKNIGETTFEWLNELKAKLDSREGNKQGEKSKIDSILTDLCAPEIAHLKNEVIMDLSRQFPDFDLAAEMIEDFNDTLYIIESKKNVKELWRHIILNIPEEQLRRLILTLIQKGISAPSLKRLLTYLKFS